MSDPKFTKEKKWFDVKNVTTSAADVFIYDEIGDGGATAADFIAQVSALKVATLNVHINSPGGAVFDGFAIYNAILSHPAEVVVYIDGLAASIASVIAMAGNEIRMAENAMIMIHNPSCGASGTAGDMRTAASVLDKLAGSCASIYAGRSGMSIEAVRFMMGAETWLTAQEALEAGFCDVIEPSKTIAAKFDLSAFKNPPAAFVDTAKQHQMSKSIFTPIAGFETVEAANASIATAVAAALAKANTEHATAQTEAVRLAIETATNSHNGIVTALKVEHTTALNALRAELATAHNATVADLNTKLAAAEALSAANLGVQPVRVAPATSKANTPAEILAHYRALNGTERTKYFEAHDKAIWAAYDAENKTAS